MDTKIGEEAFKIDGHYKSVAGYNYSRLFFNEISFFSKDYVHEQQKLVEKYRNVGPLISIFYIIIIFALKRFMKDREKFSLRIPLILWNTALATFSIMGAVRTVPEIWYELSHKGLEHSLCNRDFLYGVVGYWSYLFTMSKIFELVDTVFIVLRKAPLMFLHYYHHATILAFVYYWYPEAGSTFRWFGSMNYIVHSFMYSYYALKAMNVRVPKLVSVAITCMQIFQMIIGLWICFYVLIAKQYDTPTKQCGITNRNLKHAFAMYLTYLLLFMNFFVKAYLSKKTPRSSSRHSSVGQTKIKEQ